jgi:hypothetical protein
MAKQAIHTIYKLKDGTRVPSVTTYLSILSKPALIHWAWQCGVQGLDYNKVREASADIGTLVHYLVLCKLEGKEPDLSDYTPNDVATAAIPMKKFDAWLTEHKLEPILMETPLISEKYKFGGTPDFYGKDNGKLTLLDFKTSGAVYDEYFYQLAAYKKLLEEYGYRVESVRILRIGKSEDEGFEDRPAGKLDKHWEIFLACQQIYELKKITRRKGNGS